ALRLAAGALVALALVAAVAIFALVERSSARKHERSAHAQELRARAGQLAAQASLDLGTNPQRSLELALSAAQLAPNPGVEAVLREALLGFRLLRVLRSDAGAVTEARLSPDGRFIAAAGADGHVRVYSTRGRLLHSLAHGNAVTDLSFDAHGSRLATASLDHT